MPNKELDLFKELIPAIDMGIKELYDAAGDDGKKDIKGDLWILNRWVSSIQSNPEKQSLQILKVNEYYNKNWNVLGGTNHNKLQWQLLCVAGNVGKKVKHVWIPLKKGKQSGNTKAINLLAKIYPNMKMDEVELLARTLTTKDIKQLAEEHGFDSKSI